MLIGLILEAMEASASVRSLRSSSLLSRCWSTSAIPADKSKQSSHSIKPACSVSVNIYINQVTFNLTAAPDIPGCGSRMDSISAAATCQTCTLIRSHGESKSYSFSAKTSERYATRPFFRPTIYHRPPLQYPMSPPLSRLSGVTIADLA